MKLVTYNIQYTKGKDGVFDVGRIVETVRGADIIALQEVDRARPGCPVDDQPAAIAADLPEYFWTYAPEIDLDASRVRDDGTIENRRRQHGNMLLSRWPILSSRAHLMPWIGSTSHSNGCAVALEGVIRVEGGRALRVYSLHLSHLSERERLQQIDWLLDLNRRVWLEGGVVQGAEQWDQGRETPPMPFDAIYLGDFNLDPNDSKAQYDRLVGPLDPDYGRVTYRDLLVDAWVAAGNEEGTGITYPGGDPRYPNSPRGWYLDYGFVTPTLASKVRSARIDTEAQGSDHQPVWFEIDL